jgi:hypothetical protein
LRCSEVVRGGVELPTFRFQQDLQVLIGPAQTA